MRRFTDTVLTCYLHHTTLYHNICWPGHSIAVKIGSLSASGVGPERRVSELQIESAGRRHRREHAVPHSQFAAVLSEKFMANAVSDGAGAPADVHLSQ